jgi:hypothetical protein
MKNYRQWMSRVFESLWMGNFGNNAHRIVEAAECSIAEVGTGHSDSLQCDTPLETQFCLHMKQDFFKQNNNHEIYFATFTTITTDRPDHFANR